MRAKGRRGENTRLASSVRAHSYGCGSILVRPPWRKCPELLWFLDAGNNERPARSTGRRPKSAKARSRGKLGTG
jgi:hypothetical protein